VNIVNRVFDSSGPEGKVRGTPQQIIDKYTQLARDAQLSNDRVAAENFQQHSEHYTRMLGEAQREADARREQHEAQQAQHQQNRSRDDAPTGGDDEQRAPDTRSEQREPRNEPREHREPRADTPRQPRNQDRRAPRDLADAPQPDLIDMSDAAGAKESGLVETPESTPKPQPQTDANAVAEPAPKPKPKRAPRKLKPIAEPDAQKAAE
jgi:hypothetical protein